MNYPVGRLGDFVAFSNGRSSPERMDAGQFKVFGSNGPIGRSEQQNAPPLTTVIGRVGTYCGSVHFAREASWVTDNAIKAVANEHDEGRFWYYALLLADLGRLRSGSGQPLINQRSLNAVELPVPPRPHRLMIASILGSLDDKIELNRQMNETLEAMAQAIFRDWFVEFGPTRRKIESASDPVEIMGGLVTDAARARQLAELFPATFGDNGLPAGWYRRTVGEDFDITMGQSPPGSTYNEVGDGLPFFQGRRDFGFRFPENRVYCSVPTRIAERDSTLISVRAPVGDVNRSRDRCCIGRGVGAILHRRGLRSFTYYSALELKPDFARFDGDGTVFGSINQKQLKELNTCGSDQVLAQHFDEFVQPIDELIRNYSAAMTTLAATRDLILPKLMSGEIRLREAEEHLEAAR